MVLVYSSIYAKITNDGLGEFLDDFDLDLGDLANEIDLPGIDLADALIEQDLTNTAKEIDPDELTENLNCVCPKCGFEFEYNQRPAGENDES